MGALGAAVLLLALTVPAVRADALAVRYANDRVTASLDAAPLDEVLAALAGACGADVRGAIAAPRDVTMELDDVPLPEALQRLLGDQNFTVSYGADRVKTIVLLGGPGAPPSTPTATMPAPAASGPPVLPLQLARAFVRHRPVAVPDALAAALGAETATFPELLQVATSDDDGVLRAQATQAVLSALEKETGVRRSFLRTLHRLDTAAVGSRVQEILEYLAAHSREPSLQKKAGVVLQQLRSPTP
jgi:hypothetical protein